MKLGNKRIYILMLLMFVIVMAAGCKAELKQIALDQYIKLDVEGLSGRA